MYGTCGRIDNKADFDFFDFDLVTFVLFCALQRWIVDADFIWYSNLFYLIVSYYFNWIYCLISHSFTR